MGHTIFGEGICIKVNIQDNAIRFKDQMNRELGPEAPLYIEEKINKKSTTNSKRTNGM